MGHEPLQDSRAHGGDSPRVGWHSSPQRAVGLTEVAMIRREQKTEEDTPWMFSCIRYADPSSFPEFHEARIAWISYSFHLWGLIRLEQSDTKGRTNSITFCSWHKARCNDIKPPSQEMWSAFLLLCSGLPSIIHRSRPCVLCMNIAEISHLENKNGVKS